MKALMDAEEFVVVEVKGHRSAKLIRLDTAASDLPAPLHPGAARFYRETGKRPDGT